ncbi:MAG: PstS family phosphate ABC transporter substrate-binding protein [Armatimonadetes bacterium]|nr:MAG: PstS family phosphate ABC transporter substrate-binding protein [Armatimonadota bacterium]
MKLTTTSGVVFGVLVAAVLGTACQGGGSPSGSDSGGGSANLSGSIAIDGSSTVFPISEAVAEEFQAKYPNVRVTVGISGTGGGFKKFLNREIDISDASRPIKPSEVELAQKNGVEYIELPIAFDGLSVLVNPQNDWVDHLTVAELKKIWEPGSTVKKWSDIRPNWPNVEIKLYGPGHDSGTFDYFTEAINGKEGAARQDFMASEDDNVLVTGIAGDKYALGFFGYAYYVENKDKLKVVPIDGGDGPVTPSIETIMDGSYKPLSRPIFIYVRADVASRPEIQEFVKFYLTEGKSLVQEVGYIPLTDELYELALKRFQNGVTGSVFHGKGSQPGVRLQDLLKAES